MLGLKHHQRLATDQAFLQTRLRAEDERALQRLESEPSLFDLTDGWLARMPFIEFENFDFWSVFQEAVQAMLASDRKIIESNPRMDDAMKDVQLRQLAATSERFAALLDKQKFDLLRDSGEFRFSQRRVTRRTVHQSLSRRTYLILALQVSHAFSGH